jgi:hypothetical protein
VVGYLEGDLHGVDSQLGGKPLLGCLEDQGQADQVGYVELLEGSDSLRGVLSGRAAHQGEASEGHHRLDEGPPGAQGIEEELLHWVGEVQPTGEDGDDLQAEGRYYQPTFTVCTAGGQKIRSAELRLGRKMPLQLSYTADPLLYQGHSESQP